MLQIGHVASSSESSNSSLNLCLIGLDMKKIGHMFHYMGILSHVEFVISGRNKSILLHCKPRRPHDNFEV